MKLTHRAPSRAALRSDEITPEYQAEVDRTMAHAEAEWKRAQKRLAAAEKRLARVRNRPASRPTRKEIQHLEILVELRRVELEQTHRLMVATGFPSTARGRKSFRPVPSPGSAL